MMPSSPGIHIIRPASRQQITDCHIRVGKRLFGRPANHAPKNAAGIGRINRILTAMLLRPSTAPISTPEPGFEYRNPRQAADQHQQIAVKGAGAEQRFVAGQKFGARRPFRARFRHPLRHAEGHPGAQDQQESVAGAPAPQGVEDAAEQRRNQRADQNTHI